ncbi:MAG: hypothetical protein JOZ62_15950, partial [Acidobacteriaceae bacterium]|nr:hypothetical protein [Acidobacteriaceae bacterium]
MPLPVAREHVFGVQMVSHETAASTRLAQSSGFRNVRARVTWAWICGSTVLLYWLCLQFFFPHYFNPLAPFHVDCYLYAAERAHSLQFLILHYPRPAAWAAMHLLAYLGFRGLMAGEIVIAVAGVLLTIALAARLFGLTDTAIVEATVLYCFLLFAHPDFYFEHRHDLPAEVSYLFLMLALHGCISWVRSRSLPALVGAVVCAVVFVFAKETFFLSAVCLMLGLTWTDRRHRRDYAAFTSLFIVLEVASLAWARHGNSPFVNLQATGQDAYRIDLSPGSLFPLYWYYLRHAFTPAAAVLVIGSVWISRKRNDLALNLGFLVAGLAPYLLHAALPNHTYEEYAWIGAPLAYTPLLVAAGRGEWLRMRWQAWSRGARGVDAASSELLVTDLSRSVLRHCGSWCMALLLLLCVI